MNITWKIKAITSVNEGVIKGPMSPMLTGQAVAKHMEYSMYGIFRIYFYVDGDTDTKCFQVFEHGEGYTGYDHTLILLSRCMIFCVQEKAIAMISGTGKAEDDICIMEDTETWGYKLDDTQLRQLMQEGWEAAQKYMTENKEKFKKTAA